MIVGLIYSLQKLWSIGSIYIHIYLVNGYFTQKLLIPGRNKLNKEACKILEGNLVLESLPPLLLLVF